MSKIISVQGSEDYKILIDFEDESRIIFNMKKIVGTLPYFRLNDLTSFQAVKFDEKSVYWEPTDEKPEYFPLRLSIDKILFSLRD